MYFSFLLFLLVSYMLLFILRSCMLSCSSCRFTVSTSKRARRSKTSMSSGAQALSAPKAPVAPQRYLNLQAKLLTRHAYIYICTSSIHVMLFVYI